MKNIRWRCMTAQSATSIGTTEPYPLPLRLVLSCPPQISRRPLWSDNSLGRVREILLASWINVSTSNFHGWLFHACDLRCILSQAGKLMRYLIRSQLNKIDSTPKQGSSLYVMACQSDSSGPHDLTTLWQVRKSESFFSIPYVVT